MFYQVLIETSEKVGKSGEYKQLFELDKTDLIEIENDIVIPYLQGSKFQFDGYFIKADEVKRIVIKETKKTTSELSKYENDNMSPGIIMFISREDIVSYDKHTTDITKKVMASSQEKIDSGSAPEASSETQKMELDRTKVFIVHGHDDLAKTETARFIEKMGFEPIILHEQASSGSTIIEKIEKYSNVGFGVVLYTPCDVGAKSQTKPNLKPRARQNVVFEHGFLNGKLGRHNVCALVKGDVETPNDISGVVYVPMDEHGAWKVALAKEMRNSGYDVDMNKVI
ncbi:MAG: nucleotide-binding protein [Gammaproteobacteria bacterium]|nr:nucleotide-binding protein [Gammaproteobacteria bacterium]